MNVVLIGYRGVGKTTVGRRVADLLGWQFIDCDALVERSSGCSIAELFATRGEAAFRALEHASLMALEGQDGLVIATGGGVVLDPRHPAVLRRLGLVVWLTAPSEILVARLAGSERPRLTALPLADEVALHLAHRTPLYARTAHLTIEAGALSVQEAAARVVDVVRAARQYTASPDAELDGLQAQIDQIDDAMVELLAQRLGLALRAGIVKTAAGRSVVDPPREQQVVDRWLSAGSRQSMDRADLEAVVRAVIDLCRKAQQRG